MGLYDNVTLRHTDPVTGEDARFFQTKCGPRQLLTLTPKELVDWNEGDEDGVTFYDYYYDYKDNGEFDSYYEEYCYDKKRKVWEHILTRQRIKPDANAPKIKNVETLTSEIIDEKVLWLDKEAFMQEMSDKWDAEHPTK